MSLSLLYVDSKLDLPMSGKDNLETVGAGSVNRESPGAKGRDMNCVERDGKP